MVAVAQLTVPAGVNQAVMQTGGADVRFTLDGTTPTTALGFRIVNRTTITLSATDVAAKFIAASGTTVAVNAVYTL